MTKRTLKKLSAIALALVLSLGLAAAPASAAEKTSKTTVSKESGRKNITLKKLTYDLKEKDDENVNIDFKTKVKWQKGSSVSVKDSSGTAYKAYIEDRDSDEVDLYVKNLAAGKDYTIILSGIRARSDSAYGKLTIRFSIPAASTSTNTTLKLEEIEYDADDRELNLDFRKSITVGSNVSVQITDASGKTYRADITDWDSDEIEIRVLDRLSYGQSYTVKISNIKAKGASSYTSFSKTFRAIDD